MSNDPRSHKARLMLWLENTGPDDWHRVAQSWNWDGDMAPLLWIIRQPICDKATALLIFWRTDATYYLPFGSRDEVPRPNQKTFDLLYEIRQRWLDGLYARSELAYDPVGDGFARSMDAEERSLGARLKFQIPMDMRRPLKGRTVDSRDFIEGLPPEVAATKN